jgi:hypothetical protein
MRIPGHCVGGTETTVPAHIRDRHKGGGTKASDISVANACFGCHTAFDQGLLTNEEWLFYALRGLQETLEQRVEDGLLIFPHDPPKEPEVKPRKPKEKRAPIQQGKTEWPKQKMGKRQWKTNVKDVNS